MATAFAKFLRGFLFSLLLLEVVVAAPEKRPAITGTFVQLQGWMMKIDEKGWTNELDAMRKAGLDTVILQWLRYDQTRLFPVHAEGNDAAEIILSYADRHDMRIFLGLDFSSEWWKKWDDKDWLKKTATRNVEFAATLWRRYGKHRSFAGWYLPYELADIDFDDAEIKRLRGFFRTMSDGCRKASRKRKLPVAKSAFFAGRLSADAVEKIHGKLLDGAGVDILIVQDGVGANDWETTIKDSVPPYLDAFRRITEATDARLWLALETFGNKKDDTGKVVGRVPGDLSRIREQIEVGSPIAGKTVMFDFFHYMSPHREAPHKALFEEYLKEVRPTPYGK